MRTVQKGGALALRHRYFTPTLARDDLANCARVDTEITPNGVDGNTGGGHFFDGYYGIHLEPGILPTKASAVQPAICGVADWSIVPDVGQAVIGGISVVVAALHPGGAWPDKCPQNKQMDIETAADAILAKTNTSTAIGSDALHHRRTLPKIGSMVVVCPPEDHPIQAPHVAEAADFVQTLVAWDCAP